MGTKVLLVGINHYSAAPLSGCINDIMDVRDILNSVYRVPAANLHLLQDSQATRANILTELHWLATPDADGKPAVRLFHYSGHGSQVGDQNHDEPDGSDECLVPFDYVTSGMLVDDDLGAIYRTFAPDTHLLLLMDCCHSGSIQRAEVRTRSLPISKREQKKIAVAKENYKQQSKAFVLAQLRTFMTDGGSEDDLAKIANAAVARFDKQHFCQEIVKGNCMLISACTDQQTAADARFGARYNGALTYYLLDTLHQAQGKIAYQTLIEQVGAKLQQNFYDQEPQMSCDVAMQHAPFLNFGG